MLDKEFMHMDAMKGGTLERHAGATPRARRAAAAPRARPKTIHVDGGALHAAEGMLASAAKQPSSTNLAGTALLRLCRIICTQNFIFLPLCHPITH